MPTRPGSAQSRLRSRRVACALLLQLQALLLQLEALLLHLLFLRVFLAFRSHAYEL